MKVVESMTLWMFADNKTLFKILLVAKWQQKSSREVSEALKSLELAIGLEPTTCSLRMWLHTFSDIFKTCQALDSSGLTGFSFFPSFSFLAGICGY
ncbi:MAG: hypothetical protein IKR28_10855 [Selenomonadaceae bacterium]|nr:hypothetical protein [Selenomonadaceae bacterium]